MASFFDNKARAAAAAAANGGSSAKAAALPKEKGNLQPWVEKYRPKTLNDVTAQDHTITVLQRTLQTSNLPHMLFYGPPGTGKTSTILALAKELYGPEMFKSRVLELNASDERGISIVREKVKDFARMQLSNPPLHYRDKHPCPPYKIVILDEADSMTQDAQSALRRTMETYSKITRFCLICNYVTRIIDPLASRCSKFRFKSLDQMNAKRRLEEIAELEAVKLETGVVNALIKCSEGDLRKAITFLQSAARLAGAIKAPVDGQSKKRKLVEDDDRNAMEIDEADHTTVTVSSIEEIAGVIPNNLIKDLVKAMQPKVRGVVYNVVSKVVTDAVADGWSASQLIIQLYQQIIYNDAIPDKQKSKIVIIFSEVDKRLVDGADEHLMILDLALRVSGVLAEN
ncbi:Subunit of heteropentameric Replication factor C (RF-C) [Xanthoria parietina]